MNITDRINHDRVDSSRLSSIASSVLLNGTLAISNTINKLTDETVLYTGNGSSQSIVTGIGSKDINYSATVAYTTAEGNNLAFDRSTMKLYKCILASTGNAVTNGTYWLEVADDVVEFWDSSKVHIKSRSFASSHFVVDSIRGAARRINTDNTAAEALFLGFTISAFNMNGFTVSGQSYGVNDSSATYVAHQIYYNKVMITTTNHGKRAIVAFNDVTNESMTLYQGSGIASHEIAHGLGEAPEFTTIKPLNVTGHWSVLSGNRYKSYLNLTNAAEDGVYNLIAPSNASYLVTGVTLDSGWTNFLNEYYIAYSKASSATRKIGTYVGTGQAGNKVVTGFKPSRLIIKAVSGVSSWHLTDNKRALGTNTGVLYLNISAAEYTDGLNDLEYEIDGFSLIDTTMNINQAGVTYHYEATADTNSNGGGAYSHNEATKITTVLDTDTRTGRDFKAKVDLDNGEEVTRLSIPIKQLG